MYERVQIVRENIIPLAGNTMLQTNEEFELVQLNKNQLYDKGIDSKSVALHPYRSLVYAEMKFNKRGIELVDLFLSGEFQRNFYIIIESETYGISSTDEKTEKLIAKYGDDIFGFTEENKINAFLIIKPSLVEKINEILQCTIT